VILHFPYNYLISFLFATASLQFPERFFSNLTFKYNKACLVLEVPSTWKAWEENWSKLDQVLVEDLKLHVSPKCPTLLPVSLLASTHFLRIQCSSLQRVVQFPAFVWGIYINQINWYLWNYFINCKFCSKLAVSPWASLMGAGSLNPAFAECCFPVWRGNCKFISNKGISGI
jgi:hypothetical protein